MIENGSNRWRRLGTAILLTLPVLLLMGMMVTQGKPLPKDPIDQVPLAIAYVVTVGLFFLIAYTGRTHRYRSILFITYAVCFVLTFIPNLLETRGSMSISRAEMIQGHTPNGTAVCSQCFGERTPTWARPFLKEYRPCPYLFHL